MLGLAIVCVALVALLAYREWGARADRRQVASDRRELEAAHAEERRELYQRIQAPDLAVDEHVRESRGPNRRRPRPIAADDDAAYVEREARRRG